MSKEQMDELMLLEDMSLDYVPLHDIVRSFSGFSNKPSNEDFENTLVLLKKMIPIYEISVLEGPDMKDFNLPLEEFLDYLKVKWNSGEYDQIDYGVWFTTEK